MWLLVGLGMGIPRLGIGNLVALPKIGQRGILFTRKPIFISFRQIFSFSGQVSHGTIKDGSCLTAAHQRGDPQVWKVISFPLSL